MHSDMKKKTFISICLLLFFFFTAGCKILAKIDESSDINRGWRHHRRGDYKYAIWAFEHALKHNPQSAEAYVGLAMSWEDKGDLDKAIEYFSTSIRIEPKASTYYFRGLVWGKKDNDERAIEDYTSAIRTDPTLAAAYINRAYHYRRIGNFKGALQDYDKALQLNPNDSKAVQARSEVLLKIRQ